jgi:two-component system, OmpR family, sensor histidine kinase KdpD
VLKQEKEAGAPERKWHTYAISLVPVGLVTLAAFYIVESMARTNVAMLYLLTVVISALRFGRGPAILNAVVGSLIFDIFFAPPYDKVGLDKAWFVITSITLLVVGLVISTLASRAREETRKAQNRERYTAALYSLSRSLAAAGQLDQILEAIALQIVQTFHHPLAILLPEGEALAVKFASAGFSLDDRDRAPAASVLAQGKPDSTGHAGFLPLKTWRGTLGVLAIHAGAGADALSPEQWQLLEGFASQAASAIERARLAEEARQAQILQEANKLQKALLNSVSHNLRTPLASITGTLASLLEDGSLLDPGTQRELLETAQGESERLNRVVGNLLDMTRLEAGVVGVRPQPADIQDVVGTALEQLGGVARDREIRVQIDPNLPLANIDPVLISQVLVNLLDNALKYSPGDRPVDVRAGQSGEHLRIEVEDRGIGIAAAELEQIFERFYRSPHTGPVKGVGLGLSICKRFVEAHGGSIAAASVEHSGTVLTCLLPLESAGHAMEVEHERARTASSRR